MAERLQRYLARSGVASRRHAEALITAGRVTVNNQPATQLGTKVEPNDLVALDGKLVMPPEAVSWYVLYKPVGVVTTLDDLQGRPTVRGLLGSIPTRVFPSAGWIGTPRERSYSPTTARRRTVSCTPASRCHVPTWPK